MDKIIASLRATINPICSVEHLLADLTIVKINETRTRDSVGVRVAEEAEGVRVAAEANGGRSRSTNLNDPEATGGAKIGFAFKFPTTSIAQELGLLLEGNQRVLVNLVVLIDPTLDTERH